MTSKLKLNSIFLLIVIRIVSMPVLQAQGLKFYGNKEPIGQRTTFSVFDKGRVPVFTQYIDLSLELKIQDFYTFGYLFHIVDTKNNVAYSFTYTYIDKSLSSFKFNTEGKDNLISMNFVNDSIRSKWIPVRLHIDLASGQSSLSVAGKIKQSISKLKISKHLQLALTFGRRENLVDVPPFMIRNLSISGDKQLFSFPLNESGGNKVHDANGEVQGNVINPCWLINEFYHWKKTLTI